MLHHPVMGWWMLGFLALLAAVPAIAMIWSTRAAWHVSHIGTGVIVAAVMAAMIRDLFRRRTGSGDP
jgi:hypothetical protein